MIRRLPLLRFGLCCVLFLGSVYLAGCDSTDAQDEFEDRAFARPYEGFTSMTSTGDTVDVDEDDWAVGPLYVNSVDVISPAYPNPTAGELVTIEIVVLFNDAIRGQLVLYGYSDQGRFRLIETFPETIGSGFYSVSFSPTRLSQEPGLRRVFVFDASGGREALVTYGDVMLE